MQGNVIIYPTDFSPCAENALVYATHLAKATESSIVIVHEIDVTGGYSASMISTDSLNIVTMMEDEAKVKMTNIQERLTEEGIKSDTQIIIGNKLIQYFKNIETDGNFMVVMGTKGSGSVENRIFGSQTHKIIREVDFPVVVVPVEAEFKGIGEILFATDYESMNMVQLKKLTRIGTYFHSNIHTVHVAEGQFQKQTEEIFLSDFEQKVRSEVDYPQIDFQLLYSSNIEDRLHAKINEENVDMLVLVTQKRSFFERFFGTSLTKQMVYHTHIPMLVFSKK